MVERDIVSGNGELTLQQIYGTTLAPMNRVVALIQRETDPRRMADFAARAQAMRGIDRNNAERSRYWAELEVWSTRRVGELLDEGKKSGTIAKRGKKQITQPALLTLADLGMEDSKADKSLAGPAVAGLQAQHASTNK